MLSFSQLSVCSYSQFPTQCDRVTLGTPGDSTPGWGGEVEEKQFSKNCLLVIPQHGAGMLY